MTAPTPPEVVEARVVEEVARAMWNALPATPYGWDGAPEQDRRVWLTLAAAAVTAYRAAQDGGAEEAVRERMARVWADPFGQWSAEQADAARQQKAEMLRAALATQAGEQR